MIPLEKYASSRNWYCLGYFGPDESVLRRLLDARPLLRALLPGLHCYISCRPEFASRLEDSFVIPSTELKQRRHEFAFFEELRSDGTYCPVERLLDGVRSAKMPAQKLDVCAT